jgi:hypothetical protein
VHNEAILKKVFSVAYVGVVIATIPNMSYLYHLRKTGVKLHLALKAMTRGLWFWVEVLCIAVMLVSAIAVRSDPSLEQRIFWSLVGVLSMVGIISGVVLLAAHWWNKSS